MIILIFIERNISGDYVRFTFMFLYSADAGESLQCEETADILHKKIRNKNEFRFFSHFLEFFVVKYPTQHTAITQRWVERLFHDFDCVIKGSPFG